MSSRKLKLDSVGATSAKLRSQEGEGTVVTLHFNRILTNLEVDGVARIVEKSLEAGH